MEPITAIVVASISALGLIFSSRSNRKTRNENSSQHGWVEQTIRYHGEAIAGLRNDVRDVKDDVRDVKADMNVVRVDVREAVGDIKRIADGLDR